MCALDDIPMMKQQINYLKKQVEDLRTCIKSLMGDFPEELPLLPPEIDSIHQAIEKKIVRCCGGSDSQAYQEEDIVKRIRKDILFVIKREYGLKTAKPIEKLKRDYFKGAVALVKEYTLPVCLNNTVVQVNEC